MQENEEIKNVENKKSSDKTKKLILIPVSAVAAVFLVCTLVFSTMVLTTDKVFPGVEAGGISLEGLTFSEAAGKIEAEFGEKITDKQVKVSLEEKEIVLTANDIEARLDAEKSVENLKAYSKSGNVFSRIGKYIKGRTNAAEIDIASTVNEDKLHYFIEELIGDKEIETKETSFAIEGDELIIERGHSGKVIDREAAAKEITDAVFTKGKDSVELSFNKQEAKEIDLDAFYKEITRGKENAFYERVNGEIVVSGGFPEVKLEKSALKEALSKNLEKTVLKVEVILPDVTKADLEEKLFRDKMGSWTSYFKGTNIPRSENVHLTAKRINGVTLMPGEVFSYDKTVGKRTAANGYKAATVYVGNKTEQGIGGGICQTSSTLYSAVLYANLEIVSRTSHSLPVSYMPAGQDATIAEGYIDFKFKNNTDYPVKIVATTTYGSVTCSIMGVKPEGESVKIVNTQTSTLKPKTERVLNAEIPKGYKIINQKGVDGYTTSSVRIVSQGGKEVKRENLSKSVYRAQDHIIEINPEDAETPEENLLIYDPTAPPVIEEAPVVEEEGTGAETEDTVETEENNTEEVLETEETTESEVEITDEQ